MNGGLLGSRWAGFTQSIPAPMEGVESGTSSKA